VVAKAAKCSLPSWVQTPFRCRWRAPVSSTPTQAGAQHLARLVEEGVLARVQQADDLPLGDEDADRPELGHQARHGHLTLVVLGQHKAAQLGPEVAGDAGRHRRGDGPAVGGEPALAAEAHHVRAEHEVLDQEGLVALKARAGGDVRRRDDPLLVDGQPRALAALGIAAPARPGRCGFGALLHAAGLHLGPALHALEGRDLRPQLGDHPPQGGVLGQQPLDQRLQLAAWQARKGDLLRRRHGRNRSGPRQSGATASAHLSPAFCPSYEGCT
jgi:hypothetical protein